MVNVTSMVLSVLVVSGLIKMSGLAVVTEATSKPLPVIVRVGEVPESTISGVILDIYRCA